MDAKKDLSSTDWLLRTNPYLHVRLLGHEMQESCHFPIVKVSIHDETQVLYIRGVMRCFSSIEPFLEKGGKVVFVEENLSRIQAFLTLEDFPLKEGIHVILPEGAQVSNIAWKTLFQKTQMIGELSEVQAILSEIHLSVSDYRDFGKKILGNAQRNIGRTSDYVDGKALKGIHQGTPILVCGAGPSLTESIEKIHALQSHAVIIGCGSAIPILHERGIRIDYGAIIDPDPPLDQYPSLSFPLFYQNRVSSGLLSKHTQEKIWMGNSGGWPIISWLESHSGFEDWYFESGWNVGNFGLAIATHLGGSPIILVGLDSCMTPDRDLKGEEYFVDGQITRKDLHRGISWMESHLLGGTGCEVIRAFEHLSIPSAPFDPNWEMRLERPIEKKPPKLPTKELSLEQKGEAIGQINQVEILEAVEVFLAEMEKGVDHDGFVAAHTLMEAALIGEPLYEEHLLFLWKLFESLYKEATPDGLPSKATDAIAQAQFFRQVLSQTVSLGTQFTHDLSHSLMVEGKLEGEVKRYYPSGKLYSKEYYVGGKCDGVWESYYESGALKSRVGYRDGALHGIFELYEEEGLRRQGQYQRGLKVGCHKIWNRGKTLIFEGAFQENQAIGSHRRYSLKGHLAEEIEHLDRYRFNKRLFDEEGNPSYESVFEGDCLTETKLKDGEVVEERKGVMKGGKIEWT